MDAHWRSQMVSHRNVYLLDLQITSKGTSLFCITNAESGPKQSYHIVNKFYNMVLTTPPSSIASASAEVPHGKTPNIEISLFAKPPLDLPFVVLSISVMQVSLADCGVWLVQPPNYGHLYNKNSLVGSQWCPYYGGSTVHVCWQMYINCVQLLVIDI